MSKSILAKSFISKFSFKTSRDFGSSKFYTSISNGSSISLTIAVCISLGNPAFLKQGFPFKDEADSCQRQPQRFNHVVEISYQVFEHDVKK